jgi:hypothetical protein
MIYQRIYVFIYINLILEGPVTTMSDGKLTLVGVTSFTLKDENGLPCSVNIPAAYARVSDQLNWIQENTDVAEWKCGV